MAPSAENNFYDLQSTIDKLTSEFHLITEARRAIIQHLTAFAAGKVETEQSIKLNFICTHNSRRSHIAQIWAQTAAYYYGIKNVETFSGGTEATAFNPRAVTAMRQAGFVISKINESNNPEYEVTFSATVQPLKVFSKKYDDELNPTKNFAAIMTCSHADTNCPIVTGASARIALTYDDPKDFDGTEQEGAKYTERVNEIGREILFAFAQLANKKTG